MLHDDGYNHSLNYQILPVRYQLFLSKSKVYKGKQLLLEARAHKFNYMLTCPCTVLKLMCLPACAVNLHPRKPFAILKKNPFLSSAMADKCRRNCQNTKCSLTDFCLVLFWEHTPWWTSLFSSIVKELSGREADRAVQLPYCVTLVLQLHADFYFFLHSFCCLYQFTQMHTMSVSFISYDVRCFCTMNRFPIVMLITYTSHLSE